MQALSAALFLSSLCGLALGAASLAEGRGQFLQPDSPAAVKALAKGAKDPNWDEKSVQDNGTYSKDYPKDDNKVKEGAAPAVQSEKTVSEEHSAAPHEKDDAYYAEQEKQIDEDCKAKKAELDRIKEQKAQQKVDDADDALARARRERDAAEKDLGEQEKELDAEKEELAKEKKDHEEAQNEVKTLKDKKLSKKEQIVKVEELIAHKKQCIDDLKALEKELAAEDEQLKEVRDAHGEAKEDKGEAKSDVKDAKGDVKAEAAHVESAETHVEHKQDRVDELKKELKAAEQGQPRSGAPGVSAVVSLALAFASALLCAARA